MRTLGWKSRRSRRPFREIALGLVLLMAGLVRNVEAGVNRWTSRGPESGRAVRISSFAFDPFSPGSLYACSASDGIFKSVNGGESWTATNRGFAPPTPVLALDPSAPTTLYAGTTSDGIFKSGDGGESWTARNVGLTYHVVIDLAIDPRAPGTLYAATNNAGIFKSTDGALSWRAINTGLQGDFDLALNVRSLVLDRTAPATLYAATAGGLFKTVSGGASWTAISAAGLTSSVRFLAMDPLSPPSLYAVTFGGGLFKSSNGGGSWAAINVGQPPDNSVTFITLDPSVPSILYILTPKGLFKSSDAGQSWRALDTSWKNVFALAVDPRSSTTLYAGTDAGIFKSGDGGDSWTAINIGVSSYFQANVLAADPAVTGTLYAGTDTGVFKSSNGGGSWKALAGSPPVKALALDPSTPTTLYAGTDVSGVFKSTDGGASWIPIGLTGLYVGPINVLAVDPSTATIYAGTLYGGVFTSTNGGSSWTGVGPPQNVYALAIDPSAPATIYAGTSAGVLRSTSRGNQWTATGLSSGRVLALTIDPSAPATLYAGTEGGAVFKSTDSGDNWIPVNSGLKGEVDALRVNGLVIDPSAPATIYAGTLYGGVFKSDNGGESWIAFNSGLPDSRVLTLLLDPSAPGVLYAGTFHGVFDYETVTTAAACVPDPTTLCLNGNRFKIQVSWRSPDSGTSGTGNAIAVTGDTGFFWFFNGSNVELMVKVVDGRAFNDYFWVFFGALTNVEYTVTVTDSVTGATRTYFNPAGQQASVADTSAFLPLIKQASLPADESLGGAEGEAVEGDSSGSGTSLEPAEPFQRVGGSCTAGPATLCLNGGRFQVQVNWQVPSQGKAGAATAVSLTADTGYFWFFSENNVELVIKVLDGRAINGRFWVFYGALSNVEYTITVTDTQTGTVKTYFNPSGTLASVADTAAF